MPFKLKHQSISDQVYEYLREEIINGGFRLGQRLVVNELANKLGVSATPVREAVSLLSSEGLVEVIPRSGTYVVRPAKDNIIEVCQLRRGLELLAIELAIHSLSDNDLRKIDQALKKAEVSDPNTDSKAFLDSDRILHRTIVNASGNKRLIQMAKTIQAQVELFRLNSLTIPNSKRSMQYHRAIFDALKNRDVVEAKYQMDAHLRDVQERILEVICSRE